MVNRRNLLALAGASILAMSRSTPALAEDECDWLISAIAEVDSNLATLDDWVNIQGPQYVSNLKVTLEQLQQDTAAAGNVLSGDRAAFVIETIGAGVAITMAIVGVGLLPLEIGVGATILVSFGASYTLLVAKAWFAPANVNGVETATLQTVGDVAKIIEASKDFPGALTVAARKSVNLAGNLLGFCEAAWSVYSAVNAFADMDEQEERVQDLRAQVEAVLIEIDGLAQPGNLRALREEQLMALRDTLLILSDGCTPASPLD